jgi:hypothetical protein
VRDQREEWQGSASGDGTDPENLFPLIRRINELLGAKEKRLVANEYKRVDKNVAIPRLGSKLGESFTHLSAAPFGRRSLVQPMNGNVLHGRPPMADNTSPSPTNLKFPGWQHEFEAALLEADQQKLRERLEAAEVAMFLRSQALVHGTDGHAEQQAIRDATAKLRLIQTEKLGYPDWNKK